MLFTSSVVKISDYSILLVEDEPDQVHQIQETLSRANLVNPLRVVRDGEQAIACLSSDAPQEDRVRGPVLSLVLIDLTLPGISGLDLLKWIRSRENLGTLPVVLLTSMEDGTDPARFRALGAHSCLIKPITVGDFQAVMKSINVYWMLLDQAPTPSPMPPALPSPTHRVLVVDPNVDFLREVREALHHRAPSWIVEVASTPVEALNLLARYSPNALVCDLGIGTREGGNFLSRVLVSNKDLPILILSETGGDPAAATALQMGAWSVLTKPIHRDSLAEHLHDVLRETIPTTPALRRNANPVPVRPPGRKTRATRRQDTEILGSRIDFQETSWDLVRSARDPGPLDELIRLYWKPLYFFVRQQGYDNETAKDLVQDFLVSVMERATILKADRSRGRFRTFLLAALGNFLKDRHRSSGRKKRGGGQTTLSLDGATFQQDDLHLDDSRERPEVVVDRAWARNLLQQCISELPGRPSHLQAFELNRNGMEYDGISRETGLGKAAAKTAVHRLRRKLRGIIRERISGPMATEEEDDSLMCELSSLLR